MKMLSTSALAKEMGITSRELQITLIEKGWVIDSNGEKKLTDAGKSIGGDYKTDKRYGTYIVWPDKIAGRISAPSVASIAKPKGELLTATSLGNAFEISNQKINLILSELGWIKKSLKGWEITKQGETVGGVQLENTKSGVPYVSWSKTIMENKTLLDSVNQTKGNESESASEALQGKSNHESGFRDKFEAKFRSTDGHYVRSKAEMLIDNWLYMAEIVHAYERKLPVEEEVYCDFYLPGGKVYIEYWGYEDNPKYLSRKKTKIEIYEKYAFKLIQLNDADVVNLDDVLPRLLLKHGIQSY
ncbi:MAG: glycerol kinase [Zetaproteobacteria bacterium CG_4_9_14_3_um_filter_49_83]|nr:MAG: glycerol kinase [Zetaproteobacteria bacterium CG1_02_49_23]PIQ31922.1 MAG: glycerol kinase [Zetaproteobacteria bacterium CG17_big_fil_post_rev_8_21_14_2_50_50_13]PIV29714.1 MAG: glycerol kinase [Zetaproteobacteria bacterium CG02_land_8_20_14_3_00_50_9]PIY56182.1 MAG: glycerol kinase [Zetaproteobacteria bacterium CG_4_10_14_0_8_um_filter_49_80]PJA33986.1 MAG: glycerol kinase [Zetaproteobacteria bacterium CG_4_9_14_3_um_filter_49_83]